MANRHAKPRPQYIDLASSTYHPQVGNTTSLVTTANRFSRKQFEKTGAVRRSSSTDKQHPPHVGKLTFAAAVIAGAVVWTTSSSEPLSPSKSDTNGKALVEAPAFFFDDETDALEQQQTDRPASTPSQNTLADAQNLQNTDELPVLLAMMTGSSQQKNTKPVTQKSIDFVEAAENVPAFVEAPEPAELLPELTEKPVNNLSASKLEEQDNPTGWQNEPDTLLLTVSPGDTFSGILNQNGFKIDQMSQLLVHAKVKEHLSNIDVGQILELTRDNAGQFKSLTTRVNKDLRININKTSEGFSVDEVDLPVERKVTVTAGKIEQSLFLAAERADLQQSTIMELANIFQWELDFARDIREGDRFSLVYNRLYREGEYIGDGDILAADFMRGGKTYKAVQFTTDEGETGYYSPDGMAKRRTFMRHPVDVVRITSKFNPNRLHPVLHQIRAHRGVDYGSPHGSPIYATADGKVVFSGSKNAYGNTVVLKHGDKFSTLYAHMSRISDKSKVGSRVNQGDVIGYVGNTGRVTGTHLHYEFRINGTQIDPLKVELPAAEPLAKEYHARLRALSEGMTTLMANSLSHEESQVAEARSDAVTNPAAK